MSFWSYLVALDIFCAGSHRSLARCLLVLEGANGCQGIAFDPETITNLLEAYGWANPFPSAAVKSSPLIL